MVRMVDITWPFFQPTRPKLFSRITNNGHLDNMEYYLLRDRRDCCPKMDYIVHYSHYKDPDGIFVEKFNPLYYKTPLETEWTKMNKFYNWFDNKKLFNLIGQIPIPKSMINTPSIDPEKSVTIYYIP
jgi:hypothetical protein